MLGQDTNYYGINGCKHWAEETYCNIEKELEKVQDRISKVSIIFQLKFIHSEKATKILRNLPLTFDYSTYSQKLVEDFAKFCGLLRIYEL